MNAVMWSAIGLAIAGAVGLTMLIVIGVRFNKPSLAERVAPQMRGHTNAEQTERATLPMLGTLSTISTPLIQAGVDQLNKLNLGNAQLTSRLAQAGSRLTVADYRAQQLIMAVGAAILAISGCIWAAVHHALNPIIGLIIVTLATVLAFSPEIIF